MLCDIKVGLTCNNACVHCIMEPMKKAQTRSGHVLDSDTDSIKGIIANAAKRGFSHITLTGGEVTVRRDFPELVLFALAQDLTVIIQTNGRQLARPNRRDFLKDVVNHDRVNFVIALHGPNEVIHDTITRRLGSFQQTLRGIEYLRNEGFRVCGKLVISRINLAGIADTLRLLKRMDVDQCVIAFPHAEDFTSRIFHQVVPRYGKVAVVIEEILNIDASTLPADISYETIPYCAVNDLRFWRSSLDLAFLNDRLQKSETLIEMSMTAETINWNTSRLQIKTKPAACCECLLDHLCEGPWTEYVTHFGDGDFHPITNAVLIDQFIEEI